MSNERQKLTLQYRKQAIMAMTPRERLIMKLDLAWKAANEGDMNRLRQILILLRKSLNFKKHPLIALNALRIYRHCELVLEEKQDFAEVAKTMFYLKRAFTIAQEMPMTPEAVARREKINQAKRDGALFFGKHGRHYGPKPKGAKKNPRLQAARETRAAAAAKVGKSKPKG